MKSKMEEKEHLIALYESEADRLFRYCFLRISNREQAVDMVQEVFMKWWEASLKYRKEGKEIDNPRALLFAIANNMIIDWYRKKKSVSLDDLIDIDMQQFGDESHLQIEIDAEGKMLLEKLNLLHPTYRQVVYLRFVEDLLPKEIAEILGLSANVVSVRIDRGLKELKKMYE